MKRRLKKLRPSPERAITIAVLALAACLLVFKLGSLTPGLHAVEQLLPSARDSLSTAWNEPLFLPYTLTQALVALVMPTSGLGTARLPSILLAFGTVVLMFWLLRLWYGQRLAVFGGLLLLSLPWFLHIGRLADVSIMYPLTMAVILLLSAAWHKKDRSKKLLYVSAVSAGLLIYTPGAIWLLLCLAIIERRNIISSIKAGKLHSLWAGLIGAATLIPLINNLITNWQNYSSYLGWTQLSDEPIRYPLEFAQVWQYVFLGGYAMPQYNLGRLPLVGVLLTILFAVGVYLYAQHRKAARTKLLALLFVAATILAVLSGINSAGAAMAFLLPIIVVLATGGTGYLLHLWLKVFPRNPLARSLGIGLIVIVVGMAFVYNVRHFYVAWANNAQTKAAFSRQL